MLAKEMKIGKKYRATNGLMYRAVERRPEYFLVYKNGTKEYYRMHYDTEVEFIYKGQDRISKERLDEFIKNIKKNFWYKEQKTYIVFLNNGVKYKLYYDAQKVLVRQTVFNIQYDKKYANNYYAYKVSKIIDFIESK